VTTTKAIVIAILLTLMSIGIGVATGVYIGYRKAQEALKVDGGTLRQTVSNLTNYEETVHNIAADGEGEFGKRAAVLEGRYPFQPPVDGRLTEKQIAQFVAVKNSLMAIDQEMAAESQKEGQQPSAVFLLKWNFFSRLNRLRMTQIEALEEQRMSFDEYNWVHVAIFAALIKDGMNPAEKNANWATEVQQAAERSAAEIDRQLADPSITAERRAQLEQVRSTISQGRDALTDAAHSLQKAIDSVPEENRALVAAHREELGRVFSAALDMETVDIMKAMEKAKGP